MYIYIDNHEQEVMLKEISILIFKTTDKEYI